MDHPCSVLIVTDRPELDAVGEAVWAGAAGLVTSDMCVDGLLDAVGSLAAGRGGFSTSACAYLYARSLVSRGEITNWELMPTLRKSLRPAEHDALLAYARSGTINDAVSLLGGARLTIRNNADVAPEQLGAANRVQAIWFALRGGVIGVAFENPRRRGSVGRREPSERPPSFDMVPNRTT